MIRSSARASNPPPRHPAAERFLQAEAAFRLGALVTETPHPKTLTLDATVATDTAAGLRRLLSVDEDIPPVLHRILTEDPCFVQLRDSLVAAIRNGGRIIFTGCGATGRLSILLEAMWRTFWTGYARTNPRQADRAAAMADRVRSVMAGGDFALIRSVEGFEDFPAFGRRQLRETGVQAGDVVVAVTEGGETPFVIGTAWEGLNVGAKVFFVFNNPADLLRRQVQRSREILDDPRVTALDLTTGPMAVTGSTRMQATTCELIVLGSALEHVVTTLVQADIGPLAPARPADAAAIFATAIRTLCAPDCLDSLTRMVDLETAVYRRHGRVTYYGASVLLDVLTDTTERSPTFMVPPFRATDDPAGPVSWAFVKHPLLPTPAAWEALLTRPPRTVDWTAETYAELGAPAVLQQRPPDLSIGRLHRFQIGNEPDSTRTETDANALILLCAERDAEQVPALTAAFELAAPAFQRQRVWTVGGNPRRATPTALHVPLDLPPSPLDLWSRVAVKLVLNTVSTATMARLGRLRGNDMIWVNPTNKKLIDRGTRLVARHTGLDYDAACHALFAAMDAVERIGQSGRESPSPVAWAIDKARKGTHR